jgi:hypothetical protein
MSISRALYMAVGSSTRSFTCLHRYPARQNNVSNVVVLAGYGIRNLHVNGCWKTCYEILDNALYIRGKNKILTQSTRLYWKITRLPLHDHLLLCRG